MARTSARSSGARRNAARGAPALRVDASTAVPLDEPLRFMRTLWVVVHALQKASKRMSTRLGVTGPQRLAIRVVGLTPGISAGGLATTLHLHPSTLTGILQRLESQGILSRVTDPGDARRSELRLTARGERVNVAMAGTVESAVRAALKDVSMREQDIVSGVLTMVASRLDGGPAASNGRPRRRVHR